MRIRTAANLYQPAVRTGTCEHAAPVIALLAIVSLHHLPHGNALRVAAVFATRDSCWQAKSTQTDRQTNMHIYIYIHNCVSAATHRAAGSARVCALGSACAGRRLRSVACTSCICAQTRPPGQVVVATTVWESGVFIRPATPMASET